MQLNTILAVVAGFCLAYVAADLFSQTATPSAPLASSSVAQDFDTLASQVRRYQAATDDALREFRAKHAELSEAVGRLDAYLRQVEALAAEDQRRAVGEAGIQLTRSADTELLAEHLQAGG